MDSASGRRASANDERASIESIFLVRTALYLESTAAGVQAEKDSVAAGCEVGLEL